MPWTLSRVALAAARARLVSAPVSPTAWSIWPKLVSMMPRSWSSSATWPLMSVANFTTFTGRPAASKIGL